MGEFSYLTDKNRVDRVPRWLSTVTTKPADFAENLEKWAVETISAKVQEIRRQLDELEKESA